MILGTLLVLIAIFLIMCIVPFLRWIMSKKEVMIVKYEFPEELYDYDLCDLEWETPPKNTKLVMAMPMNNRGSVRLAQGRILTKEDLEEKRARIMAVELP